MNRIIKFAASVLVMTILVLLACSCTEDDPGFVVPVPDKETD